MRSIGSLHFAKSSEPIDPTVSKSDCCMYLAIIMSKLNRLIKKKELTAVMVPGERYERITAFSLQQYMHKAVVDLDSKSNRLKKSLQDLATIIHHSEDKSYIDGQAILDKFNS